MISIALNKAHFPVTVLGPGRRIGLWTQGCSIGCKGCISQDTWDQDESRRVPVDTLVAWCRSACNDQLDGITISGGEPFDQPEALRALLEALWAWRAELSEPFDILCYSGHPLRRLERQHGDILAQLDALVPEPFVQSLPLGGLWRGSSNQPLVPISPLGQARYGPHLHAPAAAKRLQVSVEPDRIWYIGIPDRDDMARVERTCAERGLVFMRRSWR
ncbi:MAG: 4Fe-4S single cluster domain-containing protein [Betaproteobacteria bacterium]|nr:radical SAM protein [Betaproteobacteria bacterium]